MSKWLTWNEAGNKTGGHIASGSRVRVDGREGVVCVDPYFGRGLAVRFDGTDEYAQNIGSGNREILVHESAVEHTLKAKEVLSE